MNSESNNLETTEALSSEPGALTALDRKILQYFPGLVVRKDLSKGLKQNAVVPTYVLEYLLGQHCATDDPAVLKSGLESVQRILAKHYVHRNQAELVKSTIKEKGRHKIIDKLTVELNDNDDYYQAEFTNLGLKKVPVSDDFVRRFAQDSPLAVGTLLCPVWRQPMRKIRRNPRIGFHQTRRHGGQIGIRRQVQTPRPPRRPPLP